MRYSSAWFLILMLVLSVGCKKKKRAAKPEGKVLASVDGIYLEEKDLGLFNLDTFRVGSAMKDDIIKNWVKTTLFYLQAKEMKLDTLDMVQRRLKWSERTILAQEYLNLVEKNLTIDDSEVKNLIEKEKPYFETGVKLLIIFLDDSVRGMGIRKALRRGGRVERRMLRRLRDDPTVSVMNTGWVNLGSFIYEYQGIPGRLLEEIKKMQVGEVSRVFGGKGSYVIVKMLGRKKMEVDVQNLTSFLKGLLLYRKRAKLEDSLYNYLKTKYSVRVEGGTY